MRRWVRMVVACAAVALLVACGGGGDDDTPDQTVGPPDCKARPELCA